MRRIPIFDNRGEEVDGFYVTESVHRGLLDRFDIRRIQSSSVGYSIQVPCILCEKYERCAKCPIGLAGASCIQMIAQASDGFLAVSNAFMGSSMIAWRHSVDEDVRKGLKKVRKALKALPRVRRRA